jgi:hypothetical protein
MRGTGGKIVGDIGIISLRIARIGTDLVAGSSKNMEIIEATTQIHEDILGKIFVDQAGRFGK